MPAPALGDLDMSATSGPGWYFYLNFTSARVPYTEL
jgi:hypothetical protein